MSRFVWGTGQPTQLDAPYATSLRQATVLAQAVADETEQVIGIWEDRRFRGGSFSRPSGLSLVATVTPASRVEEDPFEGL